MIIDFGYGVDMSKAKYKPGAHGYVFKHFASSGLLEEYEAFVKSNEDLIRDGEAEEIFVGEFVNEYDYSTGIDAFLVRCINDNEFGGKTFLYYDDYCIYVSARVPEDDEDKKEMLTKERIREILTAYLNPVLEDIVRVETLTIHE